MRFYRFWRQAPFPLSAKDVAFEVSKLGVVEVNNWRVNRLLYSEQARSNVMVNERRE